MPTYQVSVQMEDAYGRAASKRFDLVAIDQPTAVTQAGAFMDDLAPITELDILSYTVSERVVYTDTVTAGANRDEGVTFSVRTADNEKATVKIPGPTNAILGADGSVNLSDADVAAFIAHYTSGEILVDDGEVVSAFLSGRLDA